MNAGTPRPLPGVWLAVAAAAAACLACGDSATGPAPVCDEAPGIIIGEPVEGRLTTNDESLAGAYVDFYSLRLSDPGDLRITLASTELDPLLLVLDDQGDVQDQAFDPFGEPAGTLEIAVLDSIFPPGCHILGASAWRPGATGAYILTVEPAALE